MLVNCDANTADDPGVVIVDAMVGDGTLGCPAAMLRVASVREMPFDT